MAREDENRGFICINCGAAVMPLTNGSYRNHCPVCLCSVHVDVRPGDRASRCAGVMAPVALIHRGKKGWQIVHRCARCAATQANKIAADTEQPDDIARIAALSGRRC
jgi:RNHCP domain